ncbi:MAG: hypothetical protein IPG59_01735 [Candidatus Melainabacteria bacterium]|nr:MAG: hypothetical protein IPG59_01735 [Candidatus Melainabacteria bacterium]
MQPCNKRKKESLDLEISSPCNVDWDEMIGDERERFCNKCELNVYNVSAMSNKEAIEFLQNQNKENLCINYFKDKSGRIITNETPRIIRAVAAFFALFGLSITASQAQDRSGGRWFSPVTVYPLVDSSDSCKKDNAQNEYYLNVEKKLIAKIDEYKQRNKLLSVEGARSYLDLANYYKSAERFTASLYQYDKAIAVLKILPKEKLLLQNAELNKKAVLERVRKIIEQQKQSSTKTNKFEQKSK